MTYSDGSAARVIEIALGEIGYVEEPENITKYGKHTGADGLPWCGSFINWCFHRAGVKLPSMVSTAAGAARMKDVGRWHLEPEVGDLAFFDFPHDGIDKISHIGLVVAVKNKSVLTVEGNTSGTGDQRNGGSVMLKDRQFGEGSAIVGFARPKYPIRSKEFPAIEIPESATTEKKPKKRKKKSGANKSATRELV